MQILHAITKTESGYAIKVWEPAEVTQDRVRPCLWEINFNASTADECGLVLEQISLLHKYPSKNSPKVPFPTQELTIINLGRNCSEAMESEDCPTQCLYVHNA